MSRPSAKSVLGLLVLCSSLGCWEQVDGGKWFPQMKRQLAVQAYEEVLHAGQGQGFTPPDGTVPVGNGMVPNLVAMSPVEQDAIPNPTPASFDSLKNGELLFQIYCAACHGPTGGGDGPIAGAPFGTGPLGLVLPIGGPTSVVRILSDGHIYTTVSLGRRRMPSYRRIPREDRWDIVNYVRELNRQDGQGGNR